MARFKPRRKATSERNFGMRMIIRNCPCFVEGIAIKGNEQKTQTCNNHKVRELTYCADITDCRLKQIVELCKEVNTKFYDSVHQRYLSPSKAKFARQILKLLDIEEVE